MNLFFRIVVNILLAVDQLANSIVLGHPDETLSSRLGRTVRDEKGRENHRYFWVKWFRIFVDCLFFFDNIKENGKVIMRHCEKSIMPLEQQNFREMSNYEVWSWARKSELGKI